MPRDRFALVAALVLGAIAVACSAPAVSSGPGEPGARFVQVIAHADDDIIFMNPDLATGIRAGQPTTGIYLTAGETDKPDAEAYAARRQAGTRAAYARMAGVPDSWTAERLDVDSRHSVELYRLRAKPDVQVVFVNLPESNDPRPAGGKDALVRLWRDDQDVLRINTLVPAGGAVQKSYAYTRSDIVQLLVKLFERFRPTVVRAQDPSPDRRLLKDSPRFHDHPDHVMAARFTDAAAQMYQGPKFMLENYRDYNVAEVPANLSQGDQRDKIDIFSAYVPHDSEVGMFPPLTNWLPRQYQRYPRGSTWAGDGHPYAVFHGQLYRWNGTWEAMPWAGGPLATAVSAAGDWVVARRGNEVMLLSNGSWQSLGSPGPGDIGSPVTNGKAVYVVNGGGWLSVWRGKWTDLDRLVTQDDSGIQGSLAISGDDVYASTKDTLLHWNGDRITLPLPKFRPAGPPAAAGSTVAFRTDDGEIAVITNGLHKLLPGLPGSGNPAVAASGVVFARTSTGSLAANSGSGWHDLGGQVLDSPAPLGAGVVALCPDGQVRSFLAP